ncbi:short-chain dehydrogenase [marine bacterium AO1-C]|nr:short-chain dehydrogenase [marine bacterium AO1-C]
MSHKRALITGASKGLGFALALELAHQGWQLIITARDTEKLLKAKRALVSLTQVTAIAGDVRDEIHLLELADLMSAKKWSLDLVVNNASYLGVSPLSNLLDHSIDNMHLVLHTNMIAPISLLQKVKPHFSPAAQVVNISSDAGVEAYETWGVYGGSKAGLDHMTAILGKENPQYRFYAFDPGDMRTDMHQAAFPGEDISDRPLPETQAVPALIKLVQSDLPSGRYTAQSQELFVHQTQA